MNATAMKFLSPLLFILLTIPAFAQDFKYLPVSMGEVTQKSHFALAYSEKYEQPLWVAYELTSAEAQAQNISSLDAFDFRKDPAIRTGSATPEDYRNNNYVPGQLMPPGDCRFSETAMDECFLMSNVSPQVHTFTESIWYKLEEQVRTWAIDNEAVYVMTGGIFNYTLEKIGTNEVVVPAEFFKIVVDLRKPDKKAIAFLMPNEKSSDPLREFVVSIDFIEQETGINFLQKLPNDEERELERQTNPDKWNL